MGGVQARENDREIDDGKPEAWVEGWNYADGHAAWGAGRKYDNDRHPEWKNAWMACLRTSVDMAREREL